MRNEIQFVVIALTLIGIILASGCIECKGEGETIYVIQNPPECCPGLKLIPPKQFGIIDISGICTAKCGNGICDEETESENNCPEDCKLVGSSCGTVTPGYNDECCRNKNKDKPVPIRCLGTWIYDMDLGDCRYDCYSNLFEECGVDKQCESGECVSLGGSAYCIEEDLCRFFCEGDEECSILEIYPLQVRCSPKISGVTIIDCADDLKTCPDGTTVRRDPENNCEFYPCS